MKNPLDAAALNTAIDKVHRAGMLGVFAEVRHGDQVWRGAVDTDALQSLLRDAHAAHQIGEAGI